jgi:hypothetical protein
MAKKVGGRIPVLRMGIGGEPVSQIWEFKIRIYRFTGPAGALRSGSVAGATGTVIANKFVGK